MRTNRLLLLSSLATLATLALAAVWTVAPAAEDAPPRLHGDAGDLLQATLDVHLSLLRDDAPAARKALDRIRKSFLLPDSPAVESLHRDTRALQKALLAALDRAREFAGAGETNAAYDDFRWVERTCRRCHATNRGMGGVPETGPLW